MSHKNYTPRPANRFPSDTGRRGARASPGARRHVGFDDVRIREVSRANGQWTPPIGAMGGPPAHELYRDLVVYADLQLFRDARSRAWVVLRDGAQRRAFPVPSAELRSALDRFRMRRNLRPVPEADIDEFARIVEAHISDPDVEIPTLQAPVTEPAPPPIAEAAWIDAGETVSVTTDRLRREVESMLQALEGNGSAPEATDATPESETAPRRPRPRIPLPAIGAGSTIDPSISGARSLPPPEVGLPRYVKVFRELIQTGSWMGTTRMLSDLTGEDPFQVFESLLRFRSELATSGILLANVELDEGFRWLAVDRTKVHDDGSAPGSDRGIE